MVWGKIPHPEYANTEVFQLGLGIQHQERVTPKIISNRCLNLDPLQNGAGPVAVIFFEIRRCPMWTLRLSPEVRQMWLNQGTVGVQVLD